MKYRQQKVFSGKGMGLHQFRSQLRAIAVDSKDWVYAAGDSEVKVFDPEGRFQRRWFTSQPGFSLLVQDGTVYVGQEGQLEFFDPSGHLLNTWQDPERLGRVTALGLQANSILIADAKDRCIRRFDRQGGWRNDIGKDNRMKGFKIPNGTLDFAIDSGGTIHACNPGKHRVERYTPEGELLGHIGRFDGRNPEGFPGCCNPTNLTVSDQGWVYVTEKAGPRAKVYDGEGRLLSVIATDVFDPNCKNMDLAVDSRNRVLVADTIQLNIHVFEPEEG